MSIKIVCPVCEEEVKTSMYEDYWVHSDNQKCIAIHYDNGFHQEIGGCANVLGVEIG